MSVAAETGCTGSGRELSLASHCWEVFKITLLSPSSSSASTNNDIIFLNATKVMTLGLIWENFDDATREGNRQWLVTIFKAARQKNYSIEA